VDFRLLGPLEVYDGARSVAIGGGKRRSLLALLLLHGNEVVSVDRLIDELWGARPPPTAAKGLQVYVSQLRKELQDRGAANGNVLVTRSNGYVLNVGADELDVSRFERALSAGERALAAGEPDRAAQRLRQGLALWRGPPLADFTYEPFAQYEIARLEELRLVALEQRIDADLAMGRHVQVIGELEALVREHPLRERTRGQLMLALYRCGRQAEALETYRSGHRAMSDELGLEPGHELRDLEAKILAQSPELAAPARPRRRARRAPEEEAQPARPRRRAALAIVMAAVLLGGAAFAAALRSGQSSAPRTVALDLAKDSLVAFSPDARGPELAIPLSGRPTDLAAASGRLYVTTVDSATLTEVDARTHRIVRVVALPITPAAVAAQGDRVWVADRRRGLVLRFDAGYERPSARITYARARASGPAGLNVREPVSLATGGGAVWVTDGSRRLTRIDARSDAVAQVSAGLALDGVVGGAGALWAFSSRTAAVVRVDPRTSTVAKPPIQIATRRGADKPYPIGIATTRGTVWVLNGNTATVTRIDTAQGSVRDTVALGVDRLPRGIGASGRTVWIANFDGSVSRIAPSEATPSSIWIGDSLSRVVADGERVWVTTTALDHQLPGGTQ
jgi:DNA-binding SARP family transcriptional activator